MDYKYQSDLQFNDLDNFTSEHKNNDASSITQNTYKNFNPIFKEISQSQEEYIDLYNAMGKFYNDIWNNNVPNYFQSFKELNIHTIIVYQLKQNQAPDYQDKIIDIVDRLTSDKSSIKYSIDLVEAGIIPVLIELYFNLKNNLKIIDIFSNIVTKNINLKNQILEKVDYNLIFMQLIQDSVPSEQKIVYRNFLHSILVWDDFTIEIMQTYLKYSKVLLEQWRKDIKYPTYIFKIVITHFCEFQHVHSDLYLPFQEYVREIELPNLIISVLEENSDFIEDNQISPETPYDCQDNSKSIFIYTLLNILAIIFEKPVNFNLNLQLFAVLAKSKYEKIRKEAIFAIGNLFESMPETIQQMPLDYFELLRFYIDRSKSVTKIESLICCATAICFSNHTTRLYFVHNNILYNLAESIYCGDNTLLYMIINSIARLIEAISIESGPNAAIEAFFDAVGDEISEIELKFADANCVEAIMNLKKVINELKSES
ncbi:hypothetical protein M9Y10_011899 [Tritrichomonas musculus]|uniref:Uncharacterized protein n=1 Tax=Tritrichomonas musculus TaxID=1915356 RepID=A0ABR2IB58_9EUKA